MDEYLDQILSSPSWMDVSGVGNGEGSASGMPGDSQSQLPMASVWCQSSNGGVSSLPLVIGEEKSETVHDEHVLSKRPCGEELTANENRSATMGRDSHHGALLTSYTGALVHQSTLSRSAGGPLNQQNLCTQMYLGQGNSVEQHGNHSTAVASTVNGGVRQRIRARRGQATDPHSIAERLRRERIAERMRSLQELIPNSNKTDKASMLDEIIEYVKFLQLQVKVLSMSRLGGAGAIVPLIVDIPSEGYGSFTSPPMGQADASLLQSQDGLDFEQEVAKLMESNMTAAMQYLQNKGLCLMPIALATAIPGSNVKSMLGSSTKKSINSASDGQKSESQHAVLHATSTSKTVRLGTVSSGTDGSSNDNSARKDGQEAAASKKSNSSAPGLSSFNMPKVGLNRKEESPWVEDYFPWFVEELRVEDCESLPIFWCIDMKPSRL